MKGRKIKALNGDEKNMKTVAEVVEEYLDRQNNPEYEEIELFVNGYGFKKIQYKNVSNLVYKHNSDNSYYWICFDYLENGVCRRIDLFGSIIRTVRII